MTVVGVEKGARTFGHPCDAGDIMYKKGEHSLRNVGLESKLL